MRIVKLFSKVILLLLIVALGLYGFYYYQVKSTVDRQIQQMTPFVNAQYNSLTVNPFGLISLNTVNVSLMGQPGIVIDRISLTSDPLFFMQFESRVNRGEWPESLALAVEGLNVDFSMPLFLMLDQLANSDTYGTQPSALGCGTVKQFDMTALRMMGMRQGRFDLFLNLRNPAAAPLNLQLLANMYGWGEMLIDLDIEGDVSLNQFATASPNLQRLNLSFRDAGFNQRRNQFCSMQSGMPIAEYLEEHRSLVRDWIAQTQLPISHDLIEAYLQLSEPNASASVQLTTAGLDMAVMQSPDALFTELLNGLTITVNNQRLMVDAESTLLMFELLQQPVVTTAPEVIEQAPADPNAPRVMPGVASPPVTAAPVAVPRRYQQTPPEDLVNYIGHPVRFFTSFGKRVDGILVSVDGTTVRVAERVQHGVAQYPVEMDSIQATEVYR